MLDEVFYIITEYNLISHGEQVFVGYSGGIDSSVLVNILININKKHDMGWEITALHLNHTLRAEADKEEGFCRNQAEELGIGFISESVDAASFCKKRGISIETGARECRHRFFHSKTGKIALAHHKDDNIETIMFNLIRGTGFKGLSGMDFHGCIEDLEVIRPLLGAERGQIEAYAQEQGVKYVEDPTNNELFFTRNKLRHTILPLIEEINPEYRKHIITMSRHIRHGWTLIKDVTAEAEGKAVYTDERGRTVIDTKALGSLHPALKSFVLYSVLDKMGLEVTDSLVDRIGSLTARETQGSVKEELPGEMYALREYEKVVFMHKFSETDTGFKQITFTVPGEYSIPACDMTVYAEVIINSEETYRSILSNKSCRTGYFDLGKLGKGPLCIRARRAGDRFFPLGSTGERKLQDFLVDEKYPLKERDSLPLVDKDGEIVWVVGVRISDRFKVTPETDKIVMMKALQAEENPE
jgi:tRNA(Ile)-lysidine synthase